MRYTITLIATLGFINCLLYSPDSLGQGIMGKATMDHSSAAHKTAPGNNNPLMSGNEAHALHAKNAMTAQPNNYRYFTPQYQKVSNEAIVANKGYEHHPEIGMLFPETPCDNCYELIGKRTEISKTFIKEGTNGHDIMQQTCSAPMHYKDAQGNWRTIKTKLAADNAHRGVYAANEQPYPVSINTNAGNNFSSVGTTGNSIQFNNGLELLYEKNDGTIQSVGKANWSNYTAGDDGVYVKDAWPGIDIEIYVFRGGMKTNFIINHALPQYADGRLLIRDHVKMDQGLSLRIPYESEAPEAAAKMKMNLTANYTGRLAVKNDKGEEVYVISDVTVYEKNNVKETYGQLAYLITGNTLDIALTGNYLNREATSYPVIVDPLVSVATTATIPPASDGSTYTTSLATMTGCLTTNLATTPANVTVTDVQFANQYTTRNGAWLNDAAIEFYLVGCRSPGATAGFAGLWWYCNAFGAGTCTAAGGATYSLWSDVRTCVPPPQCTPYNLNVKQYFYQLYASTTACNNLYCYISIPLTITVFGHTVEIATGGAASASPAAICPGSSSTLSAGGVYGVPPYTWSWAPGGVPGTPAVVSPTVTTTYTATVTDACGITANTGTTVTVYPLATISGPASVCVGNTVTLSSGGVAGTWTSLSTSVATVVAATGAVTGVSPGNAVIRFTTSTGGCVSTYTITVTPVPGPITGSTTVCTGGTTTLSNSAAGGSWISSNTAVATISPSGVVYGVTPGNTVITYTFGGSCLNTVTVTVNLLTPILGTMSVCAGSVTYLSNATGGGTWSGSNGTGSISIVSGTGMVTGITGGSATVTYSIPIGCYITAPFTVNALPNISGGPNTSICDGTSTVLTATGGVSYVWSPAVGLSCTACTAPTATPTITSTYHVVGTDANGCVNSADVTVTMKPIPPAPGTADLDYCQGDVALALTASGPGLLWYNVATGGTDLGGAPVPSTVVAGTTTWYVSQTVNGCESSRSPLNVTVHNKPQKPLISANKPFDCQFDTISLSYSGPMFTGIGFNWSVPSYVPIVGGDPASSGIDLRYDTTIGNNNVILEVTSDYQACNVIDTYSVTVYLASPIAYFYMNPYACIGDSVQIALSYVGNGITDYTWNFDGGNVVVASSNKGGPYKVVWNTAGIHIVSLSVISNADCPSRLVRDTINVQPYPNAQIGLMTDFTNGSGICIGDSIQISALDPEYKNNYFWTPAHYFDENNHSTIHGHVQDAGYITLTVITPFGCIASDSVMVNAQPCCTVVIPNAFTPNGDGLNDVFRPITAGNHVLHIFRVSNRWGQTVYESVNEKAAWDGTFNGVPQDIGVYFYYLKYDCDGKVMEQKGDVNLVR